MSSRIAASCPTSSTCGANRSPARNRVSFRTPFGIALREPSWPKVPGRYRFAGRWRDSAGGHPRSASEPWPVRGAALANASCAAARASARTNWRSGAFPSSPEAGRDIGSAGWLLGGRAKRRGCRTSCPIRAQSRRPSWKPLRNSGRSAAERRSISTAAGFPCWRLGRPLSLNRAWRSPASGAGSSRRQR